MKLHLFEAFGIEAEYMIVDKENLSIQPLADAILAYFNSGKITNEIAINSLAISNEIVKHVIELKTNGPKKSLEGLDKEFYKIIIKINQFLNNYNMTLLSSAMHPWMNPKTDTYLWEYGNREIYYAYDKIFGCKGHGWSNLQSIHINLPFFDDSEFVKLHQSIRIILPLIPALSASSPFVEGKIRLLDSRLFYYENNQKKIPSITGKVIPEAISSIEDYYNKILYPMYKDIEPYDPEGILQEEWLNSRGAIARFERYTIEIRLMDIQECPLMDFTLILLWIKLIEYLIQQNLFFDFDTQDLYKIYQKAIHYGIETPLPNNYLERWNINKKELSVKDFIKLILEKIDYSKEYLSCLEIILNHGNLSQRILKRYQSMRGNSRKKILQIYQNIVECLANNHYFL